MNLQEFADTHRLRIKRDECGEIILPGTNGQVYEYSNHELGALFITPATEAPRTYLWNSLCRQCIAAGMILRQRGDAEGAFSFDPANPNHVKLALKLAGVKRMRHLSEKQRTGATLRLAGARLKRKKPTVEGADIAPESLAGPRLTSRAVRNVEREI